jgi:BON domain
MKKRTIITGLGVAASGGVLGAAVACSMSHTRCARMRDRLSHLRHVLPRRLAAEVRYTIGRLTGIAHHAALATGIEHAEQPPDTNVFMKQRVESELGHEQGLPLGALNVDVTNAVVHVRGTVSDEDIARRILQRAAEVGGVQGAVSLMHTPDGKALKLTAGDPPTEPPVFALGDSVLSRITQRWPAVGDFAVLESEGYPDRLASLIAHHTGQPEGLVRTDLDKILLRGV